MKVSVLVDEPHQIAFKQTTLQQVTCCSMIKKKNTIEFPKLLHTPQWTHRPDTVQSYFTDKWTEAYWG